MLKHFFYYIAYKLEDVIVRSGAKEPNFAIHGSLGLLLMLNIVSFRYLVEFSTGWFFPFKIGASVDQGSRVVLYAIFIGFFVLVHLFFSWMSILRKSGSDEMRIVYQECGFNGLHVLLYVIISFVLFFVSAMLQS